MNSSVELQVISKIILSDDVNEVETLCSYDESYYAVCKPHIEFILNHKEKYGKVPDEFTFVAEFPNIELVPVSESLQFLEDGLRKNKQRILFLETYNKLAELGSGDIVDAWRYLEKQCDKAEMLNTMKPMDIVKDAEKRADEIIEFNKQRRIPTGFKEHDKAMYGGLSTVEELLLIIARTNTGKSWLCTKMMESAQRNGFPVLYYSPEMQSSFIGTRFDTWRGHFKNSDLHKGNYSEDYKQYLKTLVGEETGAIVVEDKDMSEGRTTVRGLEQLVKKNKIKLLIIDGLSYISSDGGKNDTDVVRYKNICNDLFRLSKTYGCAVVVSVQANRATKENNDDKGEPFPTIYNIEGSDHPARIATQVFSLRQIHDTHTMEIRLEKSRNAKNDRPVFSYVWDPNTGTTSLIADNDNDVSSSSEFHTPVITPNTKVEITENAVDVDYDEDIVF